MFVARTAHCLPAGWNLLSNISHLTDFIAAKNRDLTLSLCGFFSMFVADQDKAVGVSPGLGLPAGLEEAELSAQSTPSLACLNHPFEFGEPLKRHRYGELHTRALQLLSDRLAEERAVDTGLASGLRPRPAHAV